MFSSSIAWELKNTVPFDAKRVLIQEYTSLWDAPAFRCFEDVSSKLSAYIERLIKEYFKRFQRLSETLG
jgi:vacuolar protein sorting-associated protein 1